MYNLISLTIKNINLCVKYSPIDCIVYQTRYYVKTHLNRNGNKEICSTDNLIEGLTNEKLI